MDVLQHRNMAHHRKCSICGETDSWKHSLLECNMARCVWALAPEEITDLICNVQETKAKAWLATVFKAVPHGDLTRVVVTLWALWHAHRKAIHEGIIQSPLSTNCFVERFISDLQVVNKPVNVVQARDARGPAWIPPPQGMAKVNFDAATSKNSTTSAIVAVVRGEDGSFLGASSVILVGVTDLETLEAMACREGLAIAADLLLQRFRLVTDCKNVVRSVAGEGKGSYGHIVQEIKARTRSFQEVELVHERRTANVDAHNLARSSIYLATGRRVV
nr:uncharacterized protein LOC127329168 [Lolium perenne]